MSEPDYIFRDEIKLHQRQGLEGDKIVLEDIVPDKYSEYVWQMENGLLVYGYRTFFKLNEKIIGKGWYHHTQFR